MPFSSRDKYNAWRRRRYAAGMEAIRELKSVPCADCQQSFPHYVMDFDHVPERGEKTGNIAELVGRFSFESAAVQDEIRKCDVVCANCHKIRTYDRECSGVV